MLKDPGKYKDRKKNLLKSCNGCKTQVDVLSKSFSIFACVGIAPTNHVYKCECEGCVDHLRSRGYRFCQPQPFMSPLARQWKRPELGRSDTSCPTFELSDFIETPLHQDRIDSPPSVSLPSSPTSYMRQSPV